MPGQLRADLSAVPGRSLAPVRRLLDLARGQLVLVTRATQTPVLFAGALLYEPAAAGEPSATVVCFTKVGSTQVGVLEIGSAKVSKAKDCIAEVDLTEVGLIEEDSTEVWPYLWMLLAPLVPRLYVSLKYIEMFLVCHAVSSSIHTLC